MSANGGMTKEAARSAMKSVDETINGPKSQSSPIYGGGHRTMAPTGRSSAGNDKESGFMHAPNTTKGPRRND